MHTNTKFQATFNYEELKGLSLMNIGNARDILQSVHVAEHRLRNNLDRMNHIELIGELKDENKLIRHIELLLQDSTELLNHTEVNDVFLKQSFQSKQELISIKDRCEFLIKYKDYVQFDNMFPIYIKDMSKSMDYLLTELNLFFD